MKTLFSFLAVAAVGFGGLSLANAEPETTAASKVAPKHCVNAGNLDRRMVVDKTTVLIEDGFGRAALLKLSRPCQNLDDMDRIGFEFEGSTQICGPRDVKILYSRFNEAPIRCLVESVTPLSKEQATKY
ncbi:DUF6491 family protein [Asticcacaulis sp. YBE204]|uniref:DUF6491 family protein n=1 Tax=Asticcacaulis sp. YBE204 TaxID=1282363 RepID=UPI0003C3D19C|nr:DUF6491 family protein [Asticcacaulis sp. YBE204]ESQ80528.1 hypothetical protein AEYBE204_04475 [Asticcacaulis sp. YBE204]